MIDELPEVITNIAQENHIVRFYTKGGSVFEVSCVNRFHAKSKELLGVSLPEKLAFKCGHTNNSQEQDSGYVEQWLKTGEYKQAIDAYLSSQPVFNFDEEQFERESRGIEHTSGDPNEFVTQLMDKASGSIHAKDIITSRWQPGLMSFYSLSDKRNISSLRIPVYVNISSQKNHLLLRWRTNQKMQIPTTSVRQSPLDASVSSPSTSNTRPPTPDDGETVYYFDKGDITKESIRLRAEDLLLGDEMMNALDQMSEVDWLKRAKRTTNASTLFILNGERNKLIDRYFDEMHSRSRQNGRKPFNGTTDLSGQYNKLVVKDILDQSSDSSVVIAQQDATEMIVKILDIIYPDTTRSPFHIIETSIRKCSLPQAGDPFFQRYKSSDSREILKFMHAERMWVNVMSRHLQERAVAFSGPDTRLNVSWIHNAKVGFGSPKIIAEIVGGEIAVKSIQGQCLITDMVELIVDGKKRIFQNILDPNSEISDVLKREYNLHHITLSTEDMKLLNANHSKFYMHFGSRYFDPLPKRLVIDANLDTQSHEPKIDSVNYITLKWADIESCKMYGKTSMNDFIREVEYFSAEEQILCSDCGKVQRIKVSSYKPHERNKYVVIGISIQSFDSARMSPIRVSRDEYAGFPIHENLEWTWEGQEYELTSMIFHQTGSLTSNSGHYIVIVKVEKNGKHVWHMISDSSVIECSNREPYPWVPIGYDIDSLKFSCSAIVYSKKSLATFEESATPVGIANPNNFCFSNSCLQTILNLPQFYKFR